MGEKLERRSFIERLGFALAYVFTLPATSRPNTISKIEKVHQQNSSAHRIAIIIYYYIQYDSKF